MKAMNDLMEKFIEYAIFDENDNLKDIDKKAPPKAKEAFKRYKNLINQAEKKGLKI